MRLLTYFLFVARAGKQPGKKERPPVWPIVRHRNELANKYLSRNLYRICIEFIALSSAGCVCVFSLRFRRDLLLANFINN